MATGPKHPPPPPPTGDRVIKLIDMLSQLSNDELKQVKDYINEITSDK